MNHIDERLVHQQQIREPETTCITCSDCLVGPRYIDMLCFLSRLRHVSSSLVVPLGRRTASNRTDKKKKSSQQEVEFFRMMDHEIRRGAQFLALSEGQYVIKTRIVLEGYQSTQHLLQSPRLGLEGMISDEMATEMWIRLMHACTSVSHTGVLFVLLMCVFLRMMLNEEKKGFVAPSQLPAGRENHSSSSVGCLVATIAGFRGVAGCSDARYMTPMRTPFLPFESPPPAPHLCPPICLPSAINVVHVL